MRWDMSRRLVTRAATNPPGLTVNCIDFNVDFPSDPLQGNDDVGVLDEVNDPYAGDGQIRSTDDPGRLGPFEGGLTNGNPGDTYVSKIWFQEFARVQLGTTNGTWFVISDPLLWRVEFHLEKLEIPESFWGIDANNDGDMNDFFTESMIGVDTNGDGDLNDPVAMWIDAAGSSLSAKDNAGAPP